MSCLDDMRHFMIVIKSFDFYRLAKSSLLICSHLNYFLNRDTDNCGVDFIEFKWLLL